MEIKKHEISGLFYYEKLPENFRLATVKDFENLPEAIDKMKPFLIFGENWQVFQCYRVFSNFKIEKIKYWLDRGQVFVMEK